MYHRGIDFDLNRADKNLISEFTALGPTVSGDELDKLRWNAGSYVNVRCPQLPGLFGLEWHAFTISSPPKLCDDSKRLVINLCIENQRGGWTEQFYTLYSHNFSRKVSIKLLYRKLLC